MRTLTKVSSVRLWNHGFEGARGGTTLLVVIFGGDSIFVPDEVHTQFLASVASAATVSRAVLCRQWLGFGGSTQCDEISATVLVGAKKRLCLPRPQLRDLELTRYEYPQTQALLLRLEARYIVG